MPKPVSFRKLVRLAKKLSRYLPNAEVILREMVRSEKPEQLRDNIKRTCETLTNLIGCFGFKDTALTVQLLHTLTIAVADWSIAESVALCVKEGKTNAVKKALSFCEEQGFHLWDLSDIVTLIRKDGEAVLDKVVSLVVIPDRSELHFTESKWPDEWAFQKRLKNLISAAAGLGYTEVERLVRHFWAEGVSCMAMEYFLSDIKYHRYSEQQIDLCINLIKARGLSPKHLALPVRQALERRYGTVKEIGSILDLMARTNLDYLSEQDFELALEYYRQPSKRAAVVKAFEEGVPSAMSWGRFGDSITYFFAIAAGGEDVMKEVGKALLSEAKSEARLAVGEMMASRYARWGILGREKELVVDWADNRLLVTEMLNPAAFGYTKSSQIIDQAIGRYGEFPFKIPAGLELPYYLALMKTGPESLIMFLDDIPQDEWLPSVLVISWYDFKTARTARQILIQSNLDPTPNLLNIARHINHRSRLLSAFYDNQGRKVFVPSDVTLFNSFLALPRSEKAKFSRAIKLYRRLFAIMYPRIAYGQV